MDFLVPCVFVSSLLGCGQGDADQAKELLDAVAATMKGSSAIALESEVRVGIEQVAVTQKARALLQRPNLARLEISGAGQDALIVLDGANSWHYVKARNGYLKAKQRGTAKLEQYGVGPAATLFFEEQTGSLTPSLSDAVVTREKLGEEECSVVTWTVGTERSSVWVVGDRLRKFRTTRSIGQQRFEQTITYGALDLTPRIADSSFAFTPPKGALPIEEGGADELLAVGADAPDFVVTDLDGKEMRSSDFEGNAVLVVFWFYGCSTCREEFPPLQRLHSEYAKRGIRMLAVNFGDAPETIREFFENEGYEFTAARQMKDETSRAFGVQVYPTNYLVGRDGKIAWRAIGFDEAALRSALEAAAE